MVVWMIALTGSTSAVARSIQCLLDKRADHFWLYLATALGLLLLALATESVKRFLGGGPQ